jgi:hypothetical protein
VLKWSFALMTEPMQKSPDGQVTIQFVEYQIEFLGRPKKHVFYLREDDLIDIFNVLRGFTGRLEGEAPKPRKNKEWSDEGEFWKITRSDDKYFLRCKVDDCEMTWTTAEGDGLMEAYMEGRSWRREHRGF